MRNFIITGRVLLSLFLVLAARPAGGMDWPSADAALEYNFAINQRGRPALGYGFRGLGPVRTVSSGELIYSRDESDAGLPSPLGTWVAIDHGDGLIGIYGNLDRVTIGAPYTVAEGDIAGFSGASGYAKGDGFYFSFYDRKEKRWVNPGMILPTRPHNRLPLIRSVILQNQAGQRFNIAQTRNFAQGTYRILVDAADAQLSPANTTLAPHRLVCSVNGLEAGSLTFETLGVRQGALLVPARTGMLDAERVYSPYPAFELGEINLHRGQAVIEIIIQDIAGNSRDLSYRLFVE